MLDKDVLGLALYNGRVAFSDKNMDELIATYGSLEGARQAAATKDAEVIINHFKANSKLTIPALGLISGSAGAPVTGSAVTGTLE